MVLRHFKVHLAYARVRVATKLLRMCGTRKIVHAAGLMCARRARMFANAVPVPTLAYFLVVTLK